MRVWIISPDDTFRPGFYRCRLAKQAPLVPVVLAEIAPPVDEDGEAMWDYLYSLVVDGQQRCPFTEFSKGLVGEPITEAELRYLEATRAYDRQHDTPLADARKRIDPLQSPLPF